MQIRSPLAALAGLISALVGTLAPQEIKALDDKKSQSRYLNGVRYLSVNPERNRADRRRRVKERHGKGNTKGKRAQALAEEQRFQMQQRFLLANLGQA